MNTESLTVFLIFSEASLAALHSLPIASQLLGQAPVAHSSEPSQHSGSV